MNDTNQGELLPASDASPPLAARLPRNGIATEFAPSGCSNSPLGNPIYPERPEDLAAEQPGDRRGHQGPPGPRQGLADRASAPARASFSRT